MDKTKKLLTKEEALDLLEYFEGAKNYAKECGRRITYIEARDYLPEGGSVKVNEAISIEELDDIIKDFKEYIETL